MSAMSLAPREFRFTGKVAVVTGAASGLGRASACAFAREGASVLVADINEQGGTETVDLIHRAGGEAFFVRTDLREPRDIESMVEAAASRYGKLDIAHNNAGILGHSSDVVECSEEEWQLVLATNLTSVWRCLKHEIPHMKKNGGAIVNTSSIGGRFAAPNSSAYISAKHGVIGLTRSAALDFGPYGIRVNALLPGAINTPMLGPAAEGALMPLQSMIQRIPLRRISEPREQADAVLWLCSGEASFVTGIALVVDGGITMQV
jgi:NAD(P)-dependent dehydrogenase (short-subunit alcohol dehydrogenase family)